MDSYKTEVIEAFEEHIVQDVDGFYYLSVTDLNGLCGSQELEILADYLDTLNKEWEQIIKEDLSG